MSHQYHRIQTHFIPPLLYGLHKLVLGLLSVCGEHGPAALAEAQQVESEDGPMLGQSVQVLSPEAHATSETMEENYGGFVFHTVAAKAQSPQQVFIGDGDVLFGKGAIYTCEDRRQRN